MDQQQLKIWFAGFYEGEGSISNDTNNRNRLKINIAQNDRTPLDIGKNIWGGSIRERVRTSPASDKICKGHEWQLNHNQSLKFIEDIKPFMIIPYKINQIKSCEEKLNKIWDKRFQCSFCELDFSDPSGKRRHEKINHIEKNELHKCLHCEKTYSSKDSMKRHIKLNHSSVASICEQQMQHIL
jgi:hypothetical protein